MRNLKESIKKLIKQETKSGHFSVLNNSNIDLVVQVIQSKLQENGIQKEQEKSDDVKKGELIFVAAPTGAGKDTLVARFMHNYPEKNYIELNMDQFRPLFPMFIDDLSELTDKNYAQMTNEFSYEIYYTLQEILLQEFPGTNIIITGTLRETDWVEDTFKRFKENEKTDYDVKLACLAVPKKESAISVIERYVGIVNTQTKNPDFYPGTARYTSLDYHDETFEKFPKNLEYFQKMYEKEPGKLIDSIEVYRRGKSIYELDEDTKVFSTENENLNGKTALDAVMQLRLKPFHLKYEDAAIIIHQIRENIEYLRSQDTLEEVIRDLAVLFKLPKQLERINKKFGSKKEEQNSQETLEGK